MHDERKGSKRKAGTAFLARLMPLELPVPPGFEEALGCGFGDHFLAWYWSIDTLVCDTGDLEYPLDVHCWEIWANHPSVAPVLAQIELGCSHQDADEALVLDRKRRRFYKGDREEVSWWLGNQPTPSPRRHMPYCPRAARRVQRVAHTALVRWLERTYKAEFLGTRWDIRQVGEAAQPRPGREIW